MIRSPRRAANDITQILNMVYGADRFDRGPVDVENLAMEYSRQISPTEYIDRVVAEELDGCEGVLIPGVNRPRKWAVMYDKKQNPGRRAYTVAHELGHFILHRHLVDQVGDFDGGFYCSKDAVELGAGTNIEHEANLFAATLLMPFDDFRKIIPSDQKTTLSRLGEAATRYGVSLTAATLRWLEYTTARALVISSTDGFALWAKPSAAALRSGRFIRTKNEMFEMPEGSLAVQNINSEDAILGVRQPEGVWFPEAVTEMCMKTERYGFELTLLVFDGSGPALQFEGDEPEDTFAQFFKSR